MKNNNSNSSFTEISKKQWDYISSENEHDITPAQVVDYFENKFSPRKFADIFASFNKAEIPPEDIINKINSYDNYIRGLAGKDKTAAESTRRKIDNWLKGKNEPDRIDWIKICFALNLNERDANGFMSYNSGGRIKVREPVEAVFLYFLKTVGTFETAYKFIADNSEILSFKEDKSFKPGQENYTKLALKDFDAVSDEESFFKFLEKNKQRFGSFHNKAYVRFKEFYEALANPDDMVADYSLVRVSSNDNNRIIEQSRVLTGIEKYKALYEDEAEDNQGKLSCTRIVNEYIWMGLNIRREYVLKEDKKEHKKKLEEYDSLRKMIHKLTDDETVRRMLRRERDVTRQILLLMYVITEGIPKDIYNDGEEKSDIYGYFDYYSNDLTPSQIMEEYAAKIDTMLSECGFGQLDPRNKFDWLILYSLRINLNDGGMLDRLKSIFEEIERRTEEMAEPLSNQK